MQKALIGAAGPHFLCDNPVDNVVHVAIPRKCLHLLFSLEYLPIFNIDKYLVNVPKTLRILKKGSGAGVEGVLIVYCLLYRFISRKQMTVKFSVREKY